MSYFRQTAWYRLLLFLAVALVAVSLVMILSKTEYIEIAVVIGGVAGSFLGIHVVLSQSSERIDMRLARELGLSNLKELSVYVKSLPPYRFVDIFHAVERFFERHGGAKVIETHHAEDLGSIVNSQFYGEQSGQVRPPTSVPRDIAYNEEEFFPADRFWVLSGGEKSGIAIIRVRIMDYSSEVSLEMASFGSQAAETATQEIIEDSIENSIYRYQLLQISFDSGIKDEFGDMESNGPFSLLFKQRRTISNEQIILDDEIREMLDRNVFEFHRRREELNKHGVPTKKGILFYGPPGTGKTYTCQYIYSNLENVTTLVVTGQSLVHVKTICNLARMLRPSLLVLEDVDLIFSSREINLYSTALGDLMDELDGFQSDEPVMFLLTTNAIDRLEQAIKDRPGRINQCIFFGPPNATLRKLYIERYLQPYDYSQLDIDQVVAESRGTTQAFLKELIYRAVQIALEDSGRNGQSVSLRNPDFTSAMEEMTKFSEKATGAIMGFRIES